jgi:hypothetical protein
MKKLFLTTISVLFTVILFSQPSLFKYQAVLRDASGNLQTNKSVIIIASILHDSISGSSVYSESHNATTNAYGLVNLTIGGGSIVSGSFLTIDWSNGPYFIKITVDGTEMGTSQLLSVPYALYAKTSGKSNYDSLTNRPALNVANWNTAYGWGNHATAGYLTAEKDSIAGNEVKDATNTTLTRSGAGTTVSPYTLGLNLANANTWTATQTYGSGALKVADGSEGAGKILTSDANGVASWKNQKGWGYGELTSNFVCNSNTTFIPNWIATITTSGGPIIVRVCINYSTTTSNSVATVLCNFNAAPNFVTGSIINPTIGQMATATFQYLFTGIPAGVHSITVGVSNVISGMTFYAVGTNFNTSIFVEEK